MDTEWRFVGTTAEVRAQPYPCCPESYPDIAYTIAIQRKPLFYYINLIIPCVIFNFLTCMVFILPHESDEKMSFAISILLVLGVFQLYVMEIMPVTSTAIPVVGKYIMFTNFIIVLSVFASIITINISRRSASTHDMPRWIRVCFITVLPRVLCLKVPDIIKNERQRLTRQDKHDEDNTSTTWLSDHAGSNNQPSLICEGCVKQGRKRYPKLIKEALEGVDFIVEQMTSAENIRLVSDLFTS